MRNRSNINLPLVFHELEISKDKIERLLKASNYNAACEALAHIKIETRLQRRKLAKKYHPDKGGDINKMKRINSLCDLVMKLKIQPPRPMYYRVVFGGWGSGTTTTSTYTTYW